MSRRSRRRASPAVAATRLPLRDRDQPPRALPRRRGRRSRHRLRRDLADGRRGACHDLRRPSAVAATPHRRPAAARPARRRGRPTRPRGDARGAAVQPRRAEAVREVRLPPRRSSAPLLQRRRRGRADHDHRAAGHPGHAGAHRRHPGCTRRRAAAGAAGGLGETDSRTRPTPRPAGDRSAHPGRREAAATRRASRSSKAAGGSTATSSRRRSRCTRRPAASSPRSRRGRICAGSCRCSTRRSRRPARRSATSTAIAVTYGPGLAGSLLVGINFAKTLAWVHDKPLIPVNHLEGHVYAAWLLDPAEERGAAAVPARRARRVGRPHVPRRDARSPHLPASSARPSTTRPARRSTRSADCSASAIRAAPRSPGRGR